MNNLLKICCVYALIIITAIPAVATHQQLKRKARELALNNKKEEMLNIAIDIGADVSNLDIKFEQRGKIIKLKGSVPTSNDLERILLAAESIGPFKDTRNFVKVETPVAEDGIILVKANYVIRKHNPDGPCPLCEGNTKKCAALFKEWKVLDERSFIRLDGVQQVKVTFDGILPQLDNIGATLALS